MNLLERVLTLLRANLNAVVEKADDPEKTLRQLQLDMRNQLVQVKTQVATAISESRKLQSRAKEMKVEADNWYKKAEHAIQLNNDPAARDALTRRNDLLKLSQRYHQQQQEQEQLVTTMRSALRQLEAKISEVETTIELLVARKRSALLQQRVYDTLNKTGGLKENERAARAQDAVLEAEARARALADLHGRDLSVQLVQMSEEQIIERQMRDLKAKNKPARDVPLLQEGKPNPSPLIPLVPQADGPVRKVVESSRTAENTVQKAGGAENPAKEVDLTELKKLFD